MGINIKDNLREMLKLFRAGHVSENVAEQLFKQLLFSIRLGAPFLVPLELIFLLIVINQTDAPMVTAWFSAMVLVSILVTALTFVIQKFPLGIKAREKILLLSVVTLCLIFGCCLPYYFRFLTSGYITVMVIMVAGIVGSLSGLFSMNRSMFTGAALALVGPETIYFAMHEDPALRLLAILIPIYILAMTIFVSSDFVRRVNLIRANNRLDAAHTELAENHNSLKELKQKQDGDYFLMSLLAEPLGRSKIKKPVFEIDFLMREHKRFYFRHWRKEIGGDINIADEVKLGLKRYVVLLNADAMGKSMQGAGGALVLGSVLQSVLVRTRAKKPEKSPEQWLQETLDELQGVFLQFEGSMLVSMVLALIDCNTGVLYYINAEHPFPVLLRDRKAGFLNETIGIPKIGVPLDNKHCPVFAHRLYPNDVIFFGSDGKDDLFIEVNGKSKLDNDEQRFLRLVESHDARAPLKQLYREILQQGR